MGGKRNEIIFDTPGVYGNWVAIGEAGQDQNGKRLIHVRCPHGEFIVRASKLATGRTSGCLSCARTTHGLAHTHAYHIVMLIQLRCTDPTHPGWDDYGGRGIGLYEPWHGPEGRIEMIRWILANLPQWQPGQSIDRIDNSRGYEPGNLRWATDIEQANNRRSNRPIKWDGRTQNLKQWAKEVGIPRDTIAWRLKHGWTKTEAFTTPPGEERVTQIEQEAA